MKPKDWNTPQLFKVKILSPARDIPGLSKAIARRQELGHAPRPIKGAGVRMGDGRPMVFFDDGSLRHALGRKVGKAGKKILKRMRQEERRRAVPRYSPSTHRNAPAN